MTNSMEVIISLGFEKSFSFIVYVIGGYCFIADNMRLLLCGKVGMKFLVSFTF